MLAAQSNSPDRLVVILGLGVLVDAKGEGGRGTVEGALLLPALPVDDLIVARLFVDKDAQVFGGGNLVPAVSVVGTVLSPTAGVSLDHLKFQRKNLVSLRQRPSRCSCYS